MSSAQLAQILEGADVAAAYGRMNHNQRVDLVAGVLELAAQYMSENGQFMSDIFRRAEAVGFHILPQHFYSPIPDPADYHNAEHLPTLIGPESGVDIWNPLQRSFFEREVLFYAAELSDVPVKATNGVSCWDNEMFGVMDSSVYYAILRCFKPRKIIEVGSGCSTLIAVRAVAANKSGSIECIEPYPTDFFSQHLRSLQGISLIEKKVQDVPLDHFAKLQANDVLFIDSSHVVKPGSDLEYLIYRVLPILHPGVVVHFHDIFLPFKYPREWMTKQMRFWNENYVIGTMLANSRTWDIVCPNCILGTEGDNLDRLCTIASGHHFEKAKSIRNVAPGGSIWLRKRN